MKYKILSLFCLLSFNLCAQDFDPSKLDSLLSHIEKNQKGIGSISIFSDGNEVYQHSFGYANIEENLEANNETKYRVGSVSKTFTATIIMKLIEQKKIALDTKLGKYFPKIKNSDQISIGHLLRHRSGIYNFTNADDYQSWMEKPITKEALVDKIVANGNVFEPDEKAEYSNSNYVLLSYIAEEVEGKDFSEILEDEIVKPCDLPNTYYGNEIDSESNEAQSYNFKQNSWVLATETDMSVPAGAGAIVSTPTDINKFLTCLFNHQVVSEQSLKTMKTLKDGFGVGMFQVPFYEKIAFGHTGGIDGFQSNAFYFPKEKVSIAYTSNGVVIAPNDIMIGALSIYFDKPYEFPTFTPALELASEELDKYVGLYSSPSFPLKITVTKDDNILMAQATGQPSFTLEAYEKHKFRFEQAGLKMEFMPDENKMILRQGGGEFELKRE